mgnify:CR=1 FL=1
MSMFHKFGQGNPQAWDFIGSEGMRLSFLLRDPNSIRSYFQAMPVSLGVVVLEADLAVIAERNKSRAPYASDFGVLAEKGMQACSLAASVLAERTCVLRLDAARPIDENVRAIVAFDGLEVKHPLDRIS